MPTGSNSSNSNSNPRQVIIDDDDHELHYKGSWSRTNGNSITFNHKKLQTVPYDNSLHGTQGDGSFSLSYSFHGSTNGNVMGFADVSKSSGMQDPSWDCVLDGKPFKANDPPDSPTKQFSFCDWDIEEPGKHTVTVNVKSQGRQFFFDQITYVPDPTVTVRNATVLVGHSDRALMFAMFGKNMSMGTGSRMAMNGGFKVTFPFFGSGLSWFGKVKDEASQHMPTGYFSIDGQTPVNFTVNPPSGKGSKSTLFFKTPSHLPLGNHTITVASVGEQSAHLSLSYLVLENGQLPSPEVRLGLPPSPPDNSSNFPSASDPSASTFQTTSVVQPTQSRGLAGQASDSAQASNTKNFPFTHIITALSAVLFLVLIAGLILVIRRRRRTRMHIIESPESALPVVPTPTGSSSRSAPPPYSPPQDMTQVASPDYPFALAGNSFSNFAKRFTSSTSSTHHRPNSLFQSFRPLSPLPTKRMSFASSAGSSTRTYRPYVSRPRSDTRSSAGSTATLLPNESISERGSEPPSRKGSLRLSFPDDQTVVEEVVEHKEGHVGMWHARPPEGRESPPPSDGGG